LEGFAGRFTKYVFELPHPWSEMPDSRL
jgi:hypothetical protein